MKKTLKWCCSLVIIALLLIGFGVVSLIVFVNPNDFKALIADQIYQASGYRINFTGDIRMSFYPVLGLEINQVEVINPDTKVDGEKTLAKAQRFVVGVKLLPLFQKHIQISELYLDGAEVNLVQDAKGQFNWKIPPYQQKTEAVTSKSIIADKKDSKMTFFIPGLEARHMTVKWTNYRNKQHVVIQGISLTAHRVAKKVPFPAQLSFYIDSSKPDVHGLISLNTVVTWLSDSSITFDKIVMELKLTGKDLPEGNITSMLKGQLYIANRKIVLSPFDLTVNRNHITGAISVYDIDSWDTEANIKISPLGFDAITAREVTLNGRVTAAKENPSLRTLNGNVHITFKDGEYIGTNVLYFIDLGKSLLQIAQGRPSLKLPPLPTHMDRTSFGSMTGSGNIRQGVLYNSDFVLSSPVIHATGSGSVDLATQKINYRLKVSKADENDAEKQNIPLIITGTITDPDISVDKGALLAGVGKTIIKGAVAGLMPAGVVVNKGIGISSEMAKQFLSKF